MTFTVNLPPPPSVNQSFANAKKGRVKTAAYRSWRDAAAWAIRAQVPSKDRVAGSFYVAINLPWNLKGDIDNRIKGIVDALVTSGRVDDDRFMDEIHVCRACPTSLAVIVVKPGLKVSA